MATIIYSNGFRVKNIPLGEAAELVFKEQADQYVAFAPQIDGQSFLPVFGQQGIDSYVVYSTGEPDPNFFKSYTVTKSGKRFELKDVASNEPFSQKFDSFGDLFLKLTSGALTLYSNIGIACERLDLIGGGLDEGQPYLADRIIGALVNGIGIRTPIFNITDLPLEFKSIVPIVGDEETGQFNYRFGFQWEGGDTVTCYCAISGVVPEIERRGQWSRDVFMFEEPDGDVKYDLATIRIGWGNTPSVLLYDRENKLLRAGETLPTERELIARIYPRDLPDNRFFE